MTTPTPANQLNIRISWLAIVNYLGALLTTGWMLYLLYGSAGLVYALLALLVSGFILRFGASPLLVIAAGVLFFPFHAAGLRLPAIRPSSRAIASAGRWGRSGQMKDSPTPRADIQAASWRALPDWEELLKPWM